jgi:hypothetical protein
MPTPGIRSQEAVAELQEALCGEHGAKRLRSFNRIQKILCDMCATAQSAMAAWPDNASLPVSFSYRDLRF